MRGNNPLVKKSHEQLTHYQSLSSLFLFCNSIFPLHQPPSLWVVLLPAATYALSLSRVHPHFGPYPTYPEYSGPLTPDMLILDANLLQNICRRRNDPPRNP